MYIIGAFTLSMAAIDAVRWGSLLGLFLIGIGTGGIKACVSVFGADQFPPSPDQERAISAYFHVFYFSINLGSVSSFLLMPVVADTWGYGAAFALPCIFLSISFLIFWAGRSRYKMFPPAGSVVTTVYRLLRDAVRERRAIRRAGEPDIKPLVDYALPLHGAAAVAEVRSLINVCKVFAVLPVFWALFDQQGSTWQLQASEMSGAMGSISMVPEQMQAVNPILIVVLVPLFDRILYPWLRTKGYTVLPLPRMRVGMVFASLSFLCSYLVQLKIDRAGEYSDAA